MHTRIEELRRPIVVGGLAALGGLAMLQVGIEFERAWMRSYDGPLLGETPWGTNAGTLRNAEPDQASTGMGERRRWVPEHHPRGTGDQQASRTRFAG